MGCGIRADFKSQILHGNVVFVTHASSAYLWYSFSDWINMVCLLQSKNQDDRYAFTIRNSFFPLSMTTDIWHSWHSRTSISTSARLNTIVMTCTLRYPPTSQEISPLCTDCTLLLVGAKCQCYLLPVQVQPLPETYLSTLNTIPPLRTLSKGKALFDTSICCLHITSRLAL